MSGAALSGQGRAAQLIRRASVACLLAVAAASASPGSAQAQFGFFGGQSSAQDAYDTIASRGFRLIGPLMQNRDVFIADIVDRRQRRQRLIISREDGRILQRFSTDVDRGPDYAPRPDYVPPRRPLARNDDSDLMSRIVRGWGNDEVTRPPADIDPGLGTGAVMPPEAPRLPRAVRQRPLEPLPRTVKREDAPIVAKPLPAPAPASSSPAVSAPAPAPVASAPVPAAADKAASVQSAPVSPPAGPARATVVSTDPLRIPGERTPEPAKPQPPAKAQAAVPIKPAAKMTGQDVPVAPLE